ncbi:MAG: hypothetical protein ACKPKO_56690 [Candidatus Fonsibacter sp.]
MRFMNIVQPMDFSSSVEFKWNYITIYRVYCKDPSVTDSYI